jgi:peptidyl-prolyl cis-trans isomerase A (cyclophilin A)
MQTRRALLALAALVIPGAAFAQAAPTAPGAPVPDPSAVRVDLVTGQGKIVLELYPDKAPITTANFLHYVKTKKLDGTSFYRAMRTAWAPGQGLIQGGLQNDPKKIRPPIAHEPTTLTGIKHLDGTISMSRGKPGSASGDFFICVGDSPYLDANPDGPAGADTLGYAAFGRVVEGMEVVRAILALPTPGKARNPVMQGQMLDPPVPILTARVES